MGKALTKYRSARIYFNTRERFKRFKISRKPPIIRKITTIIKELYTSIFHYIKSLIKYNKLIISLRLIGRPRILIPIKEDTFVSYITFYFQGNFPTLY